MTPLEVIGIGLIVVFVTLGILTMSTYLIGLIVNKYFDKPDDDEKARVAAIVAAIRSRGVL